MKRKGFKDSKAYAVICQMPPLEHWPDKTQPFCWEDSEVVQWMMKQPEVMKYLFEKAHQSEAMVFDGECWAGVGLIKAASGDGLP